MVRVASNATGEPGAGLGAHRPDFDPFFDAITGTVYSAGNFANRLLNTLATLVYTAADPSMDATTTVFCDDDTDKYCYDGILYYVPRPNWVIGTRPKVPLKKWWKLSSVNKIKSFYTGAKVFEFPVYPVVAVVESARLMTRCIINLDKLQSVGDISDDPAGEKQAIWSADRVFDALDGINESFSEIFLWLLDWEGLPGFIRWAPLLWRDISTPFGHIWLGMAHWAYFAGVDTMVGAINAAQGTISFFDIMVAMYDKFQVFVVERALTVCEDLTLMVEGEDYPLGCLVKNSCDAAVQLVNGTYGLLNWALVGANECQVPGPYGTYERKTSCFKADSAERVMDPTFTALGKCGPCIRHLLSLWYYLKPGSSGGQPIEDCLARENVSWVVELVPEPSTGGVPYRPNSAFNPSAILDPPPPGPIRETSFWLPKCRNATSCYGVTCRTEFSAWTGLFEWARSASGQRCTSNPACDPRFGGCDAASCAPGCMECANGNTYWPAPPAAIGGAGNTLAACAGGTGTCSIAGQRCVDTGVVYICGARDAGDCTADASINVLCWTQQGVSTEAECMDTNGTCGVPGDTGCEPYAGVEQECGTRSTTECTAD
ncbi:MAG TPA: hypothetical protein EYP98_18500, partial [Planctomycetes bacterium]|nr:hypothetical protein [Planctomycetota bacterium]